MIEEKGKFFNAALNKYPIKQRWSRALVNIVMCK